jgi:hypothetical protein
MSGVFSFGLPRYCDVMIWLLCANAYLVTDSEVGIFLGRGGCL